MQITTFPQDATNLVAQFVRIAVKILAPYLWDQTKLFLNDIGVKKLKTKYNNKELALGIKYYIFEHRQNLDIVLANLEQAKVIIAKAKFRFY